MNRKKSIASQEHFMCTDVEWGPSGLYVATAVTQPIDSAEAWRYSMENGYKIWTFQGTPIVHNPTEQFYQFLWRPRPATLIKGPQKEKIRKGLRDKYYKKFEEEDELVKRSQMSGEARARSEGREWYKAFLARAAEEYKASAARRVELSGYDSNDESQYDIIEEEVEEEIHFSEVVVAA